MNELKEPTKKDVLNIADYIGCNGEELWTEISKLLLRQDIVARTDEMLKLKYAQEHIYESEITLHKYIFNRLKHLRGSL